MLDSLLSVSKSTAVRCVNLYVSSQRTIVAPMHQNFAGIYYEQPAPAVVEGAPTTARIGLAFREAFDDFSTKDTNLGEFKRSDWPSFKASGLRSVKEFERQYKTVICFGNNSSNSVVRASVAHPTRANIEMSVSFNPLLAHEAIGESLMQLIEAANAT